MFGVSTEKDEFWKNLSASVLDKMRKVGEENDKLVGYTETSRAKNSSPICNPLSFEEAIKELIDLKNKLK